MQRDRNMPDIDYDDIEQDDMSIWINNPNESSPFFHIKALHPHSIDIIRYYFGDIEQVECHILADRTADICARQGL